MEKDTLELHQWEVALRLLICKKDDYYLTILIFLFLEH